MIRLPAPSVRPRQSPAVAGSLEVTIKGHHRQYPLAQASISRSSASATSPLAFLLNEATTLHSTRTDGGGIRGDAAPEEDPTRYITIRGASDEQRRPKEGVRGRLSPRLLCHLDGLKANAPMYHSSSPHHSPLATRHSPLTKHVQNSFLKMLLVR
ncbi:hypothetical protein E2C01_028150 [Portunus trituberculatus]|uniref:Uncharacterized protein n=1 Tax=Portunus trituberculatus TaxID=210409 RepID=A0A5B7ENK0_PORTR|nr:hypothetical protein [Portunus trituberculatus]